MQKIIIWLDEKISEFSDKKYSDENLPGRKHLINCRRLLLEYIVESEYCKNDKVWYKNTHNSSLLDFSHINNKNYRNLLKHTSNISLTEGKLKQSRIYYNTFLEPSIYPLKEIKKIFDNIAEKIDIQS